MSSSEDDADLKLAMTNRMRNENDHSISSISYFSCFQLQPMISKEACVVIYNNDRSNKSAHQT